MVASMNRVICVLASTGSSGAGPAAAGASKKIVGLPDKATQSFVFPAMLQLIRLLSLTLEQFRSQETHIPASFTTYFTFSVSNLNPDSIGGGLAFVISPDDDSIGDAGGYIGIIASTGSPKSVWHITRTRVVKNVITSCVRKVLEQWGSWLLSTC
ncbi:hypothetical protein POM88_004740 [Heracleum sosnowskyi]|uniref:Legume lectin domain-containing protein n=1 Tax=Heracleum sosnowskyi TaxID=360622 RepID=A0AAD8N7Z8_9APIA|nr:hypothetical protein POM88_004740 [Heracleum sosnowskyi]